MFNVLRTIMRAHKGAATSAHLDLRLNGGYLHSNKEIESRLRRQGPIFCHGVRKSGGC